MTLSTDMTAPEQQTGKPQIDELADRQLRYEQRYFDCLNEIFTRLEDISKQNECSALHVSRVEELTALKETISALKLAHQADCNTLNMSRMEELAALTEIIRLRNLGIEQLQEELATFAETISALKLAHQADCNALRVSRMEELAAFTETIRLRNLGIEQLQEELSQQSFLMVNAQAELTYLRSRHPKERARRVIERFGFLITTLLPISWLRRGKRIMIKQLKFMN